MEEATHDLQKLLEEAVQTRVYGLKEVAVAFSGGLDSSVIACLAKKYCPNVQLIHVSLENQPETEEAWQAAKELDLPLQVHLFKEKDVEEIVPKVLDLIEDPEPLKVSVGGPFYWVAEKTAEAKLRVLLAGQGADELFGGYLRYVKEYMRDGDEKVRQTLFSDVVGIHESNLERDEKICGFHEVELRLPFTSYEVVKFALSLPTELKIEKKEDSLRKLALRRVAKNLNISESITLRPKKAVQYSTGISSVLKKLAKKQKITLGDYLSELFQKQKARKT
jgi:asparagine synthase (glutamine-hydrolysing)